MKTQAIALNSFQQQVLSIPEGLDLFLGGGRGGGKSYALALLAMRHIEQYGKAARVLYLRRTYKGLADFELVCRDLFATIYSGDAHFNAAEHVWRFPNAGYMELGQLEGYADYAKYQGRSFTLMLIDEAGQFPDANTLDILRSNLRGPTDMPVRVVMAGNPGGAGHFWLSHRYVFRAVPWAVFDEPKSKRQWVYCPSTFDGNQFIDRDQYKDQLTSSCPEDPELLRAWLTGDWAVTRGAYFAGCLDEKRNLIPAWDALPEDWRTYLAHDFGSAAPSATYIFAESPGAEFAGRYFPRDSLVLVDELATNKPGNLNAGLGWTVPVLAEAIKGMCKRWNMPPKGVADDAIFARMGSGAGSIADEFQRERVYFLPARKADRLTGWQRMRRLLQQAGDPDRPGLYATPLCRYFWDTVPLLPRDPKRIEDVDSSGPDHAADAVRYGCLRAAYRSMVWTLRI